MSQDVAVASDAGPHTTHLGHYFPPQPWRLPERPTPDKQPKDTAAEAGAGAAAAGDAGSEDLGGDLGGHLELLNR